MFKKQMYLFFLFCLTTQLNFCATKKGHLVHYLRRKAKQHQENKWYQQSNLTFYEANRKEIRRLARIVARERHRDRQRILRENTFSQTYPIIIEDDISPFVRANAFNFGQNNPYLRAFMELDADQDNPWEI